LAPETACWREAGRAVGDTTNRIRVSFQGSYASVSRLTGSLWAGLEQSDERRHAHYRGQLTDISTTVVTSGHRVDLGDPFDLADGLRRFRDACDVHVEEDECGDHDGEPVIGPHRHYLRPAEAMAKRSNQSQE
jgi:hypothetical protein